MKDCDFDCAQWLWPLNEDFSSFHDGAIMSLVPDSLDASAGRSAGPTAAIAELFVPNALSITAMSGYFASVLPPTDHWTPPSEPQAEFSQPAAALLVSPVDAVTAAGAPTVSDAERVSCPCERTPSSLQCFCRCKFAPCADRFRDPETLVNHLCGPIHRKELAQFFGVGGCLFPNCRNRRNSHFGRKPHACPECGERFTQKKNLFGKMGHCFARVCRVCGESMTCLTKHRQKCPTGAAAVASRSAQDDTTYSDSSSSYDKDDRRRGRSTTMCNPRRKASAVRGPSAVDRVAATAGPSTTPALSSHARRRGKDSVVITYTE